MRRMWIVLVSIAAASAGAGRWASSDAFAQPDANDPPRAAAGGPAADPKQVKVDSAKAAYELAVARGHPGGRDGAFIEVRCTWSRRWMEAERDAAGDEAGKRAAVKAHFDRVKSLADATARLYEAGRASAADAVVARYFAAEAEQWHADATAK